MSLKESYAAYFKIGAAISGADLNCPACMELVKKEFSTFTCENDMKPMFFLDKEENRKNPEKYDKAPAMRTGNAVPFLEFARENQIPMRGHTLVWHNQTPRWFFYQNYDEKGELADRETMLSRMENYIHYVLDFVQTKYPGVIYAWDVVNEAVDESKEEQDTETKGDFRDSLWLKTVGKDFVLKAFEYARKYASPEVKLFYNDYETAQEWKRDFIIREILLPLKEKGLVDGMGMQSHLLMDHPDLKVYQTALHMYGALGLEVQITELDMHNADPSEESMRQLAERYRELFVLLTDAKKEGKANVTSVTFWNLLDETTWLTGFRREKSYPLLFSAKCGRKEAYYEVLEAAGGKEAADAARKEECVLFDEMRSEYERQRSDGIREVYEFLSCCEKYSIITAESEVTEFHPNMKLPAGQLPEYPIEYIHMFDGSFYIHPKTVRDVLKVLEQPKAEIMAFTADGRKAYLSGRLVRDDRREVKEHIRNTYTDRKDGDNSVVLAFDMVSAFLAAADAPPRVLSF